MNIATLGRVCSVTNRRLCLICRFAKTSAKTPSKIAAHAAQTIQVPDPTLVTPCQPLWIHPIESTLRLYHSALRPTLRWPDSRGQMAAQRLSRPSTFATDQDRRLD